MTKNKRFFRLALLIIGLSSGAVFSSEAGAVELNTQGGKGAKVYCYMRNNGNDHEVSWNASYSLLKRQANSMFKTSPKHAAVMITEAVVQDPNKYPNCGRFLGDLFNGQSTRIGNQKAKLEEFKPNNMTSENTDSASRYSY